MKAPQSDTLQGKIDEVIDVLIPRVGEVEGMTTEIREQAKKKATTQLADLFMAEVEEIVGEDETYDDYGGVAINRDAYEPIIRNQLRKEILDKARRKYGKE